MILGLLAACSVGLVAALGDRVSPIPPEYDRPALVPTVTLPATTYYDGLDEALRECGHETGAVRVAGALRPNSTSFRCAQPDDPVHAVYHAGEPADAPSTP